MNNDISKLFKDAELLVDQGRLLPAVQTLEEARKLTVVSGQRAYVTYNLGAVHFHRLGNGKAARREFLTAIQDFEEHGSSQHPFLRVIHANALENAMLLALSFNEFENLATRLEAVNPGVPILTGLVPTVKEARECGEPWRHLMLNFASRSYNRNDPKLDVGRYGQARSTYHLLLAHRRDLRVVREDWRLAVSEFCPLSMRMAADCMKVRGGDDDSHSPEEFLPILTEALPLVDEYLSYNSGDGTLKMFRGNMEEMVTNYRQRWASLQQERSVMPKKTDYQVCQRCGTVYARRDIDGPDFMLNSHYDRSTMCLKCGGDVDWQSSPEFRPEFGMKEVLGGFFALLFLIGVVVIIVFFFKKFFG